jgi:hypothetical protein
MVGHAVLTCKDASYSVLSTATLVPTLNPSSCLSKGHCLFVYMCVKVQLCDSLRLTCVGIQVQGGNAAMVA